jgi:hypothetical protein
MDRDEIIFSSFVLVYITGGLVSLGMMVKTLGIPAILVAPFWPAAWLIYFGHWIVS